MLQNMKNTSLFTDEVYFVRMQQVWLLFSIGNDLRFEKGIEEMLKCQVHAFDPRCVVFLAAS